LHFFFNGLLLLLFVGVGVVVVLVVGVVGVVGVEKRKSERESGIDGHHTL
jgi:hypothetical protein